MSQWTRSRKQGQVRDYFAKDWSFPAAELVALLDAYRHLYETSRLYAGQQLLTVLQRLGLKLIALLPA